ncbi:MAG TPA: DNA mismatch repair protein MutS [Desulfuromonadales bacterium]|nr:DNA mismatch repair protein MutS [Desulfuromonadales bacterium]
MAKKQRQQHPPKPKEFHTTPFGALKGVGVAVSEVVPAQPLHPLPPQKTESPEEGLDLFLQAVSDVQPFQASPINAVRKNSLPVQQAALKKGEELPVIEKSAFLEEIGRLKLDTTFTDSALDDGELQPLAGNRLRQVKRGVVSVNHQLDLHGLTREEALAALPGFLLSAQKKSQKAVLVITGKGNHSPEEPVLQQAVASWLRDAGRATVLEFAPAPREMGGSGAYVVFLRRLPPPL